MQHDEYLGDFFVAVEDAEKWTMEQDDVGDIIFFHRETQVGLKYTHTFPFSVRLNQCSRETIKPLTYCHMETGIYDTFSCAHGEVKSFAPVANGGFG